jgi:hypothetical protein
MKKAYKRFRSEMLQNEYMLQKIKGSLDDDIDLSEKDKKKKIKLEWKGMPEAEKIKWASRKKQKKENAANKIKMKG